MEAIGLRELNQNPSRAVARVRAGATTVQLAERVEEEAEALGLEVVRFAGQDYGGAKLDDYHQAQAVGVMNYWTYFNSSPVPQPADLVIFDDAHLAEQPLSRLQTLRIPDKQGLARELYRTICDLAVAHTDSYPGLRAMLDGTARPGTPPELLSFKDWDAVAGPVRDAIEACPLVANRVYKDEMWYVWPAAASWAPAANAHPSASRAPRTAAGPGPLSSAPSAASGRSRPSQRESSSR